MSDFSKFKISIEEDEEPWDEIIDELDDTEILKIDEEINDKYLEESAWFFFLLFSILFNKMSTKKGWHAYFIMIKLKTVNGGKDMAVKLRLKRMGSKKRPFYRVVAADSRSPRDGRFIETVGTYNPIMEPAEIKIDEEKAIKWLKDGAIPTDTVRDLFRSQGIMEKFHNSKKESK